MTHRESRVLVFLLVAVLSATLAGGQTAADLGQHQVVSTDTGLLHSDNPSGQWFTVGRAGLLWAQAEDLGCGGRGSWPKEPPSTPSPSGSI